MCLGLLNHLNRKMFNNEKPAIWENEKIGGMGADFNSSCVHTFFRQKEYVFVYYKYKGKGLDKTVIHLF